MRRIAASAFAVALLALVAVTAARADEWSKKFPVTAKPHVTVAADNARLNVTPGPATEVAVRVSTTGWQIPKDVRVTQTQSGNDIRIEVKQTHHWFNFGHGSVAVDLSVPSQADLDLSTGNGRVTLGAVTGTLNVGTGNGSIHVTGTGGRLSLHTGNGSIHAADIDASLEAHTGNGSVRVSGRFAALGIDSGRGRVEATVLPGSNMTSPWRLRTGVGNVAVALPPDFSAQLDGSSGVGHISVDFPVTVSGSVRGARLRGTIGKGGPTLRLQTGVGNIHVVRTGS